MKTITNGKDSMEDILPESEVKTMIPSPANNDTFFTSIDDIINFYSSQHQEADSQETDLDPHTKTSVKRPD
ncbi:MULTISPECIES: hypothetical protein [Paenibacillus]|uniref:hypothetical protein n=1 Tax=Paenibacillus TaxID=44249 RepID=UPI0022B8E133|nr:hypothetical protein [Paenibacillus caseinilyticus]MCZ8522638.1 hypothetical protein [Paenibacillus caseinilyticus]